MKGGVLDCNKEGASAPSGVLDCMLSVQSIFVVYGELATQVDPRATVVPGVWSAVSADA